MAQNKAWNSVLLKTLGSTHENESARVVRRVEWEDRSKIHTRSNVRQEKRESLQIRGSGREMFRLRMSAEFSHWKHFFTSTLSDKGACRENSNSSHFRRPIKGILTLIDVHLAFQFNDERMSKQWILDTVRTSVWQSSSRTRSLCVFVGPYHSWTKNIRLSGEGSDSCSSPQTQYPLFEQIDYLDSFLVPSETRSRRRRSPWWFFRDWRIEISNALYVPILFCFDRTRH